MFDIIMVIAILASVKGLATNGHPVVAGVVAVVFGFLGFCYVTEWSPFPARPVRHISTDAEIDEWLEGAERRRKFLKNLKRGKK